MMVALPSPEAGIDLLGHLRGVSGDAVTTFEYIHRLCLELVYECLEGNVDPFDTVYEHYALIELSSGGDGNELQQLVEDALAAAFDQGTVLNAVIASSEAQAAALWGLREGIPEANNLVGGCIRHDVSVPISKVPELLKRGTELAQTVVPGCRVTPFGHIGDGNIHFNVVRPVDGDGESFLANKKRVTPPMHDLVMALNGSFSAEHGIGQLKRDELRQYRSEVELELMATVKQALDPKGIMNPGKVL